MMTKEECQEVFNDLTTFLKGKGLLWVVEQVEDTIRQGITEEKEVETLKTNDKISQEVFDGDDASRKLRTGPKRSFLLRENIPRMNVFHSCSMQLSKQQLTLMKWNATYLIS